MLNYEPLGHKTFLVCLVKPHKNIILLEVSRQVATRVGNFLFCVSAVYNSKIVQLSFFFIEMSVDRFIYLFV